MSSLELRLAWRSLGRNRRRTGLTIAATAFSLALVVCMIGLSHGSHEQMIEDGVKMASGHLSIMAPGHLEERTLEQPLPWNSDMSTMLESTPGLAGFTPRLESFALISQGDSTQGMLVRGTDPSREDDISSIKKRIVAGRFLTYEKEREIVLGQRGAETLGVSVGDEVLLYGIAYSLESAYDLFKVVGLIRFPDSMMERRLAFISLEDAQTFYVYPDKVTEVAILLEDSESVPDVQAALTQSLDQEGTRVHPWPDVVPGLDQYVTLDKAGMYLILILLVLVVGFGILNTVLMTVLERKRELGVLLALGLRPSQVFRIVYIESMLLATVGIAIGLIIAIPIVLYFQANPIPLEGSAAKALLDFNMEPVITWKLRASNPIGSSVVIFGVAILAALYPAIKASRGQPIDVVQTV